MVTYDDQMMLLAKIDERTRHIESRLDEVVAGYVRQEEFAPVKSLVFGLVALILTSVVGSFFILTY